MTQTNGVDLLRKQILDEGDELLQRMTPIRTSEEKTTPAQPDIEATLRGWLELRLASELSKEKFRDREQLITLAKTTAKFVGDQLRPLKDRIAKLENESAKQRVRIEELEAKGVNFCGSYQRGNQYRRNEWVGYDG